MAPPKHSLGPPAMPPSSTTDAGTPQGQYTRPQCTSSSAPPLPPCTQVFLTPHYLCIAMEFAPGGDMFEYVVKKNGLKEDEARWFFQQLIVGLDYSHRMVRGAAVLLCGSDAVR
jgi:serine/threonine protein kinase